MRLGDVKKILEADVLCGDDPHHVEVKRCFACDLISEMLIYVSPHTLLITSLTNAHIIHTAQVMDAAGVVFVGGRKPDELVIRNAEMSNIPLLSTPHLIFDCCGLLFGNGVQGEKRSSC